MLSEPNIIENSAYNYKASQNCIGIDYSFSGVNIGFVADREARSIELEQTNPHENLLEVAKKCAENLLENDNLHLVMGISEPSSDTDHQIAVLEGHRAGFNEVHLLYESVAAAIGAYWDSKSTADKATDITKATEATDPTNAAGETTEAIKAIDTANATKTDNTNKPNKTIASCVFRGNSLGDSTSFGLSIIEIKNRHFFVKKVNGRKHKIDNHIVKEVCLTTIRELGLKHIDEVLIVGRKDYVTKEKPLIKAVRRTFRPLFEDECKYTRGHENLVAKGLAIYGNSLNKQDTVFLEMPKEAGGCND
ncbi:MAG: hypothetical protein K6G09_05285 [Treponema sp.]|nr:hypothetical protein [Treponema sp.]